MYLPLYAFSLWRNIQTLKMKSILLSNISVLPVLHNFLFNVYRCNTFMDTVDCCRHVSKAYNA